jgi:hypothetical protein
MLPSRERGEQLLGRRHVERCVAERLGALAAR